VTAGLAPPPVAPSCIHGPTNRRHRSGKLRPTKPCTSSICVPLWAKWPLLNRHQPECSGNWLREPGPIPDAGTASEDTGVSAYRSSYPIEREQPASRRADSGGGGLPPGNIRLNLVQAGIAVTSVTATDSLDVPLRTAFFRTDSNALRSNAPRRRCSRSSMRTLRRHASGGFSRASQRQHQDGISTVDC